MAPRLNNLTAPRRTGPGSTLTWGLAEMPRARGENTQGRIAGRCRLALVTATAAVLLGCGGEPDRGAGDPPPPVGESQRQPYDMDLEQQTGFARTDLAARLSVPEEELRLLEAARVNWRDSAMGCPLPDRAYTQVITPGVLIRLAHGKTVYEYHGSRAGRPFLCEPPATVEPPASTGSPVRGLDDGT